MKLNPDPFEALGKHWEKTQSIMDAWQASAQEFWNSYLEFVKLLNHRSDDTNC